MQDGQLASYNGVPPGQYLSVGNKGRKRLISSNGIGLTTESDGCLRSTIARPPLQAYRPRLFSKKSRSTLKLDRFAGITEQRDWHHLSFLWPGSSPKISAAPSAQGFLSKARILAGMNFKPVWGQFSYRLSPLRLPVLLWL